MILTMRVGDHLGQREVIKCLTDMQYERNETCLLYTSDAADERSSVDLGGRRIIKKKKIKNSTSTPILHNQENQATRDAIFNTEHTANKRD